MSGPRFVMTIGTLRQKLAELEAAWTPQDGEVMGKFEDQHVMVPVFEWNNPEPYAKDGAFDFKGYSPEVNVYWDMTGLGLIVEDNG